MWLAQGRRVVLRGWSWPACGLAPSIWACPAMGQRPGRRSSALLFLPITLQGALGRGCLACQVLADLRVLVRGGGGAQGACLTAVVFPTDRSGMENSASVEQLQETLLRALRALVLKNRPSETSRFTKLLLKLPDLRTLNNMHSEKLLSFRVDAQ